MENHKSHIFHTKGKFILKKLSKFGSSASVRLCHCSNPGRSTSRGDRPWASPAPACPCPAFAKRPGAWAGPGVAPPARRDRGPLRAGAVASLPLVDYQAQECTRTWLYSCYYNVLVPCAHAPGTGRSHERIFSLCGGVHDVSTAEPFWKTCSQKSGSIPFSIQPLREFPSL